MTDSNRGWIGTGETPREAVREIAPDSDAPDIAWVEGIRGRLRNNTPEDQERTIRHEITVIYEQQPPEEWLLKITYEENEWQAVFIGSKKLP